MTASLRFPLIAPNPPRLSAALDALRRIEASGVFSNNGPELAAFEAEATAQLFGGRGTCLGVANATLGLMIAIRDAAGATIPPGSLALVPALTFAATAQAAEWAGLTPLIADIEPGTWGLDPAGEERLLRLHAGRLRVIVPYATFGAAIDLDRYTWLARRYDVGVVIDAAASLGTLDEAGRGFAADAPFAVVFSMHATKTFAVGEGGLVHSADTALIDRLRAMAGFGFEGQRSATLPGLNAKLAEVPALLARRKLHEFDAICDARAAIEAAYRDALPADALQQPLGRRRAMQFMPVLLPDGLEHGRVAAELARRGIGSGSYFNPHLGQQPWFRGHALIEPTPVADAVARRIMSLPITDAMTPADATEIARAFTAVCATRARAPARAMPIAETMLIGGGPAGTAMLTAAAKAGLLPNLARGLMVVERDGALGGGRLGGYAIRSDSTAQTFLSAVRDNPEPSLAALADHPAARAVARHEGALGAPLAEVGPLLRVTGDRLAALVAGHGGTVLTGHTALGATRIANGWRVRLRGPDGIEAERRARALVLATGGHQPLDRLATQQVAGHRLALAGDRLIQSDQALALDGPARIADLLAGRPDPRIVVIGGSTSALTTVALLLRQKLPLGAGAITLMHRRPLRPFYPSAEAARADGFTAFGADDICPVSGFVYRLAGFRLEARELVLRLLRVGGRRPDPRVRLHRLREERDPRAWRAIARADLVIAALGYRPLALPLADVDGRPIRLAADTGASLVDRHCRVVDAAGQPVPGVWGIGLAAGFVPWGSLGGEASFTGQANGLWLWQNDVGRMIAEQLLAARSPAVARAVA